MDKYLRKKKLLDSQVNQNEKYNVVDTYYKDLTDMEIYKYSININFIYVITQDWLIKIIEKN